MNKKIWLRIWKMMEKNPLAAIWAVLNDFFNYFLFLSVSKFSCPFFPSFCKFLLQFFNHFQNFKPYFSIILKFSVQILYQLLVPVFLELFHDPLFIVF